MALAEHLCAQPAAGGDAESVCLARAEAKEEAAPHRLLGVFVRSTRGAPCRSTSAPSLDASKSLGKATRMGKSEDPQRRARGRPSAGMPWGFVPSVRPTAPVPGLGALAEPAGSECPPAGPEPGRVEAF